MRLIQGLGHTLPGERPSKKRNSMHLIPGRVPTSPGERRWKPQGNWVTRAPAQTQRRKTSLPGYPTTLIRRPDPTLPGDWHYEPRMTFESCVANCPYTVKKIGRV